MGIHIVIFHYLMTSIKLQLSAWDMYIVLTIVARSICTHIVRYNIDITKYKILKTKNNKSESSN